MHARNRWLLMVMLVVATSAPGADYPRLYEINISGDCSVDCVYPTPLTIFSGDSGERRETRDSKTSPAGRIAASREVRSGSSADSPSPWQLRSPISAK